MKKLFFVISMIAALVCASCVKEEPNIWGGITGIVKDQQTNQPLEGVKVTITTTGASQITGSDGQYSFENLDAKEYTVSYEKSGYLTQTQKINVLAGENVTAHVQMVKNLLGLDVYPQILDFGTATQFQTLTLTATGDKQVYYTVGRNQSWLTVSPTSGTVTPGNPMPLNVVVNRGSLTAGSYDGAVTIKANSVDFVVQVHMQVAGAGQPVISVESVTAVTQTTATVGGVLTLEGGLTVTDYGVCYSTGSNPTINDSKASRGGASATTTYTCQLSGLTPGKEYYVRAYAVAGGTTYYGNIKSFTMASQGGSGSGTEDYSNAKVESDNRNVQLTIRSCYRGGNRITIEALIKNIGINASDNYYIYGNNFGYTLGNYTYNSRVEDELYTAYDNYAVTCYLYSKSNNTGLYTQLPINSPQILKVTIDGVPKDASKISLFLATEFRNTNPKEYAYLTFENVPIY